MGEMHHCLRGDMDAPGHGLCKITDLVVIMSLFVLLQDGQDSNAGQKDAKLMRTEANDGSGPVFRVPS